MQRSLVAVGTAFTSELHGQLTLADVSGLERLAVCSEARGCVMVLEVLATELFVTPQLNQQS